MTTGHRHAPAAARRVLLLLSFTRWFPVGLVIGVIDPAPAAARPEPRPVGVIFAMQGFVVLGLELPTGGFADALGRRPVLLASGVVALVSGVLFITAHTLRHVRRRDAAQGVFRALDSGPLEAWYVDAAHADDPASGSRTPCPGRAPCSAWRSPAARSSPAGSSRGTRSPPASALELPTGWPSASPSSTSSPSPCWCASPGPTSTRPVRRRRAAVGEGGAGSRRRRHPHAAPLTRAAGAGPRGGLLGGRDDRVRDLMPVRLAELVGGENEAGALMGPVSVGGLGAVRRRLVPGRPGGEADRRRAGPPCWPGSSTARSSS